MPTLTKEEQETLFAIEHESFSQHLSHLLNMFVLSSSSKGLTDKQAFEAMLLALETNIIMTFKSGIAVLEKPTEEQFANRAKIAKEDFMSYIDHIKARWEQDIEKTKEFLLEENPSSGS